MIHLSRLRLEGFAAYRHLDLDLNRPGVTFINGPTGSGKSTIPFAVYYLIFGKLLRKKTEFVTVNDLINKVINGGSDNSLEFHVDKKRCLIREIRGRKKTKNGEKNGLYFYVNGKDRRGKTDAETRKNIIDVIGVSSEGFKNVAMLGRRQSQKLINGTSSERASIISDIFGLNKNEALIRMANDDLKATIQRKDKHLDEKRYKLDIYNEAHSSIEKIKVSRKELSSLNSNIKILKNRIKKEEQRLDDLRKKKDELARRLNVISLSERNIKEIEEKLRKIGKFKHSAEEYKHFREVSKIDKFIYENRDRLMELGTKINDLTNKINRFEKLQGKCPISKEQCPVNVPKSFEKELKNNESIRLEKYKTKIKFLSKKLDRLENEKNARLKYDDLKVKISVEEGRLDALKRVTNTTEVKNKESIQKEFDKCCTTIKDITNSLSELRNMKQKIFSKREILKNQKETKEMMTNQMLNHKRVIDEIDNFIKKTNDNLLYISAASNIFKQLKMNKVKLVLELLESQANVILDKISDGERWIKLVSNRETSKGSLEKLGIVVCDSYKELPIELVSDGQEAQVGLSLLLAIWKVANGLSNKSVSSFWLDEIFSTYSNDIIDNVFEALIDLSQEIGASSIFVISHRDLDQRKFNYRFNTKLTDGISELTVEDLN